MLDENEQPPLGGDTTCVLFYSEEQAKAEAHFAEDVTRPNSEMIIYTCFTIEQAVQDLTIDQIREKFDIPDLHEIGRYQRSDLKYLGKMHEPAPRARAASPA